MEGSKVEVVRLIDFVTPSRPIYGKNFDRMDSDNSNVVLYLKVRFAPDGEFPETDIQAALAELRRRFDMAKASGILSSMEQFQSRMEHLNEVITAGEL